MIAGKMTIDATSRWPGATSSLLTVPGLRPPKSGRRLFGAGINLTHLYQGKIRYLWYLIRDFGFVNKIYRGLARPGVAPEEDSIEKLWIAAVEGFAIGGHCQILLTIDQVIAADNAFMTLPARKEGIIPGATLERRGKASVVTLSNPRFLNAEDENTIEGTEIAVDLA